MTIIRPWTINPETALQLSACVPDACLAAVLGVAERIQEFRRPIDAIASVSQSLDEFAKGFDYVCYILPEPQHGNSEHRDLPQP